jgi:hypothetical protein
LKSKLLVIIIFSIVVIIGLWFFYFVTQLTKVYDPIESYQFRLSVTKLKEGINESCKNRDGCEIEFTKFLNNKQYAKIRIKTPKMDFKYSFYISKKDNVSIINITSAYNISNKSGGYKKSDVGVKEIIKKFENEYINTGTLVLFLE